MTGNKLYYYYNITKKKLKSFYTCSLFNNKYYYSYGAYFTLNLRDLLELIRDILSSIINPLFITTDSTTTILILIEQYLITTVTATVHITLLLSRDNNT